MTYQATGAHQPLVEAVPQEATHNLASDLRAGHQSNDTTCGGQCHGHGAGGEMGYQVHHQCRYRQQGNAMPA